MDFVVLSGTELFLSTAKRRRDAADFPGASVILRQLKEGPLRRRVGLVAVERGPPARGHTAIYAKGIHYVVVQLPLIV